MACLQQSPQKNSKTYYMTRMSGTMSKSERSQHFTSASGKQTFLSVFRLTAKKQWNSNLHKFRICSRLPLVRKGRVKYRVVTRGQGGTTPGRRSITGAPKVPTIPLVLSSIQYVCFRKTCFEHGAQTWFLSRAPS